MYSLLLHPPSSDTILQSICTQKSEKNDLKRFTRTHLEWESGIPNQKERFSYLGGDVETKDVQIPYFPS